MRRRENRVEALARGCRSRRRVEPPGRTPSIASRVRRKSSLVGLKMTKWRPGRGLLGERVPARLGSPEERVVERVEVRTLRNGRPFRISRAVRPDHVARRGATPAESSPSGRSGGGARSRAARAPRPARPSGPARPSASRGKRRCPAGRSCPGAPGSRRSGTRPPGPRRDARGAGACRARSSRSVRGRRSRASRGSRSSTGRGRPSGST